jgi:hypothetical protein
MYDPIHARASWVQLACLALFSLLLAACGDSSSSRDNTPPPAPAPTFTISGTVTGAGSGTVTVTLSGAASATTTTNAAGIYSFTGLANGNYMVSAAATGLSFAPAITTVALAGSNSTAVNFAATVAALTFSISGTVSGPGNAGVSITLAGANSATTVTNSSGNYAIAGLAPGAYTVTASKTGYNYVPASTPVTVVNSNVTGQNFAGATVGTTFSISGTVSGAATSGVTINLSGAATMSTISGSGGSYSFTGLANGAYVVTPTRPNFTFSPVSSNVTLANTSNAGTDFTATAVPTFTISGIVTGTNPGGITLTLGGAATSTALTNSSGNYTFASLAAGTYTVTPDLSGYNFTPAAPSIVLSANTTRNFIQAANVASSTITGTVSYSGATPLGRVFIAASCNTGCVGNSYNSVGTTVTLAGSVAPFTATYTLHGAAATGTYAITAYMDTIHTNGSANTSDPMGSASVAVNGNTSGANLTLTDSATVTAVAPTGLGASALSGGTLVQWSGVQANGAEVDTAYVLTWGTDVNATTGGGTTTVTAAGRGGNGGVKIISGLNNGTPYYFKMTGKVGNALSASTAVFGPVTPAIGSGANTVSGSVTFPGSATGHTLYVGVFNQTTNTPYFAKITSPVNPQAYSIAGVPSGSNYQAIAIIDMNDNGVIDLGDLSNADNNKAGITISANAAVNIILSGANATQQTTNSFQSNDGSTGTYSLNLGVRNGVKYAVGATIISGPYLPLPYDISFDGSNGGSKLQISGFSITTVPTTSDTFQVLVTYSDGTQETLTRTLTSVLGATNLPLNLVTSGANRNIPTLGWTAPLTLPTALPFVYGVQVSPVNSGTLWQTDNSNGLPSTQTSVLYNADGTASQSALTTATQYNWAVQITDNNGNSAQRSVTYTP